MAKSLPKINARTLDDKWFNAEIKNLNAVRKRFREISKVIEGRDPELYKQAWSVITKAFATQADALRDKTRLRRAIKSAPRRLDKAIFSFSDISKVKSMTKRRSVLVGIRTGAPPRIDRKIYKEWGGKLGAHNVRVTKRVGMSIARMFESGTQKIQGMNFFKSAIMQTRDGILRKLAESYSQAVKMMSDK